jgi:hypothetical protein
MTIEDDAEPSMAPVNASAEERLMLVERDVRSHSRSLTGIIETLKRGFTPEQMDQLRGLFREELADAGLRIDGPEHVDDAREDFRFLRRLRNGWGGAVNKIGNSVLIAVIIVALSIVSAGFWAWLSTGGNK